MKWLTRIFAMVVGASLALVMVQGGWAHALASGSCTVTVDATTSLASHLALTPGAVLCLHGGTYNVAELQLTASGTASARITLRSYPGETAILKATSGGVARVRGAYWTLTNLVLDNNGLMTAALTITATGDHFQLLSSEVRNGTYYGVDVWGPNALVQGNQLHYFRPATLDTSDQGERHCLATHSGASNLTVDGNTIYDCWGDGLQMYEPDTYKDPALYAHNVLISNNTFKRGTALVYGSNAIDIKGVVSGTVRNNDISGYALPQVTILHQDQSAIVIHHGVQGLVIDSNHIHDGYQGMMLNATVGGQLTGLVVRNNDVRNLSNFGLSLAGLYASVVQNNTLTSIAGNAIQISGQGLQTSRLDHNLIISSGQSKVYTGGQVTGTTFGANAWYSASRAGVLINTGDQLGSGNPGLVTGFGALFN